MAVAADHNVIPVTETFIEDTETPVSAFLKLRGGGPAFLLESAEQGQRVGRWSFIGFEPRKVVRWSLADGGDPYALAAAEVSKHRQAPLADGPPFTGGAVGFFGYDCDADAILALVEPHGPACHTGARSCFHNGRLKPAAPHEALPALERTVTARAAERPEGSYTVELLADPALIGAKVEEEAEEVARAAREETDERVAEEAADVLYHLTVLLHSRGLSLADAEGVLDGRRR